MPNFSATLLLTRPEDGARRFADQIAPDLPETVRVVVSPLLDMQPTHAAFDIEQFSGVIFTSAHAVAFAGPSKPTPVFCVGSETRRRAEAGGWSVRCDAQDADALFKALTEGKTRGPLLHLAGKHRRGALADRLTHAGLRTTECILYDQVAVPLTDAAQAALIGLAPVIIPLFSPRTAQIFADQADQLGVTAPVYFLAISEAALHPVANLNAAYAAAAPDPTAQAVQELINEALRRVEARGTPL